MARRAPYAVVLAATSWVAVGMAFASTAGADDRTYSSCGFGVGMDYMCGGGVTWNIGGIFNRR
jgi:hypothetical protein